MTNKLFIGGLSYGTDEPTLLDEMRKYGSVKAIRLIHDPITGKSRGYAFITFSTKEEAQKAIDALDNKSFDGRVIGVKPATDRKQG